jgi:hypothetical protein
MTPTGDHPADGGLSWAEQRAQELWEDIGRAEMIENTPTEIVYGETLHGGGYVQVNDATFVEDAGSLRLQDELHDHLAARPELQDHPVYGRYWSGPDEDSAGGGERLTEGERADRESRYARLLDELDQPAGGGQSATGTDVVGLVCPECGEDAIEQPPNSLVPYAAHGLPVPAYSHPDGEPLCPVMGSRGYQPAEPVEVLADTDTDPLDQARAAVDAADRSATEHADSAPHGDGHTHDAAAEQDDGSAAGWER